MIPVYADDAPSSMFECSHDGFQFCVHEAETYPGSGKFAHWCEVRVPLLNIPLPGHDLTLVPAMAWRAFKVHRGTTLNAGQEWKHISTAFYYDRLDALNGLVILIDTLKDIRVKP